MRKMILFIVLLLIGSSILMAAAIPGESKDRPLYATDRIKIKLSDEAISRSALPQGLYAEAFSFGINELDQIFGRNGGQKIIRAHRRVRDTAWESATGFDRWFVIELSRDTDIETALAAYRNNRYVEHAGYEYFAYTQFIPNDPLYPNHWGHNNTGQLPVYQGGSHSGPGVGTPGFDSRAQLAWDDTQGLGNASIIIAIIDSGVDTAHPDLRLVAGYDYGDNDSNPMDDSAEPGHGTSCAGVAAAIGNNNLGVVGIAGGCSVMPLKVADSAGSMSFTSITNAITHAADNGAHIASLSLGAAVSPGYSPATDAAFVYAYNNGVTIFAATANANTSTIDYPANHPNVISVGAASPTGQRKSTTSSDGENWWGSNYGVNTQDAANAVDLMAATILPTTDISGTAGYSNNNYYMWFNGTSCATPYAAGVGALVLSKAPHLTPAQLRSVL
ncbi:MAG: S8 family serine peptidase, partial [Candidatus Cloacimonadaceae bacterium]|nr:S8 family serine peptidase [Candidatus Cloacimonadaceae bacterium]